MKINTRIRQIILISLLFIGLILFISFTSPKTLPLPFLVLPFLALYTALFLSLKVIVTSYRARTRTKTIVAGLLSSFPVLLLVFQSIHQLTMKDFLIIFGLITIIAFYLSRSEFIQ